MSPSSAFIKNIYYLRLMFDLIKLLSLEDVKIIALVIKI